MNAFARGLDELSVLDEGGQPVSLQSLWKEAPSIFVFVRHFG